MSRAWVAVGVALFVAGCGPTPVRVGSKQFTESVILGEMGVALLRDSGLPAEHRAELGGTRILFDGLVANQIDAYPEYTGTLTQELLAGEDTSTPAALAAALDKRDLRMSAPVGFHDSYALAVSGKLAAEQGLTKVSDLTRHPLRYGLSDEFVKRQDGWPGLRDKYGLKPLTLKTLDHALAYQGAAGGSVDVIDVYTTDPQIRQLGLRVLEDDRHYFPPYDAVWLYRAGLDPRAVAALARLDGRVDTEAMQALNDEAMLKGRRAPDVAGAWLSANLGLPPPPAPPPEWQLLAREFLQRTGEHLYLVAVALFACVLVAVPLGVVVAKYPAVGQGVLGTVSVIQTIPSLALLVFMIPIPGLGLSATSAIVALFLYGLLPIVRNTATGLQDIPAALRESAAVLGLPPRAILWEVELPLAARSILAGVKTAAVITVGTATLGALIGAGGYGQFILTGIRLNNTTLLLLGAVPAALMALGVQGLFGLAERWFVPRGLRLGAKS